MESWEPHMHLSNGHCFAMYFLKFNATIRFKVIGSDNSGNRTAIICSTSEVFNFNKNHLLKKEYSTLTEIDLDDCQ